MSAEEGADNHISVKVRSHRGEEVHFRVKPHTVMEKVIKAFCSKIGVEPSTVRLTFDGQRIDPKQTSKEIGLEDGDVIDVMEFQVGGSF
jgi:small ubiquitin-related modifier